MNRKKQQKGRGRVFRGVGKAWTARGSEKEEESISGQGVWVGNTVVRGKWSLGRGKIKYLISFYRCGVEGINESKCSKGKFSGRRGEARTNVTQADEDSVATTRRKFDVS